MFGSQLDQVSSFHEQSFPTDWGIFPRAVITALEKMNKTGERYIFTANIVEIYFGAIYDLLNEKKTVHGDYYFGGDFDFHGMFEMEVKSNDDVDKLIKIMHTYRQSRATVMN